MDQADPVKHRELQFRPLHPDPHQAQTAALLLAGADGIHHVEPASPVLLKVRYDVRLITLSAIEQAVTEIGLHLDNSLMLKLKRALHHYTEEALRANLGLDRDCAHCVALFVNRYQRLTHGCRDQRPEHWRAYL